MLGENKGSFNLLHRVDSTHTSHVINAKFRKVPINYERASQAGERLENISSLRSFSSEHYFVHRPREPCRYSFFSLAWSSTPITTSCLDWFLNRTTCRFIQRAPSWRNDFKRTLGPLKEFLEVPRCYFVRRIYLIRNKVLWRETGVSNFYFTEHKRSETTINFVVSITKSYLINMSVIFSNSYNHISKPEK